MPRRDALGVLNALFALQIIPEPSSDLTLSHSPSPLSHRSISLSPLTHNPNSLSSSSPTGPAGPLHALYSRLTTRVTSSQVTLSPLTLLSSRVMKSLQAPQGRSRRPKRSNHAPDHSRPPE